MELKQIFSGWIEQLLDLSRRNQFLYLKKVKAQIDLDEFKELFDKKSFFQKLNENTQAVTEIDLFEFLKICNEDNKESNNQQIEKLDENTTAEDKNEAIESEINIASFTSEESMDQQSPTNQQIQDERGQQIRRLLEDFDDRE